MKTARFVWWSILTLVFHDAKTPAAAKSEAQFSSTGDESNGLEGHICLKKTKSPEQ